MAAWLKYKTQSSLFFKGPILHVTTPTWLKVKEWHKIYHANGKQRRAGVTLLVSNKTGFTSIRIKKDNKELYTIIKGTMQNKDLMILNIDAPKNGAPRSIKQVLAMKWLWQPHNNSERFQQLSNSVRSSRQKTNQEILDLSLTLDQLGLIGTYRTLHLTTTEYIHGTYSITGHMLSHQASLNKFKKFEIVPSIFLERNTIKIEISNKKMSQKYTNTWKLNNLILNNSWIKRHKSRNYLKLMKRRTQHTRTSKMLPKDCLEESL